MAVAVGGSGMVGRGLVLLLAVALVGLLVVVIVGLALVLDISNVARVALDLVLNTLGPAVREEDIVVTVGVIAIPVLLLAKVQRAAVGIVVLNTVGILVLGVAVLILGPWLEPPWPWLEPPWPWPWPWLELP